MFVVVVPVVVVMVVLFVGAAGDASLLLVEAAGETAVLAVLVVFADWADVSVVMFVAGDSRLVEGVAAAHIAVVNEMGPADAAAGEVEATAVAAHTN